VDYLQNILKEVGLEPERARMYNLSSAMAGKFVESIKEMTEKITEIGPNPLRSKDER